MKLMTFFPVLLLISLRTVEIGGASLLRLLTTDSALSYFRARHAHAGVLLILALVYFLYLRRAEFSTRL